MFPIGLRHAANRDPLKIHSLTIKDHNGAQHLFPVEVMMTFLWSGLSSIEYRIPCKASSKSTTDPTLNGATYFSYEYHDSF